jgi:inhibitor of cysteine peptidase
MRQEPDVLSARIILSSLCALLTLASACGSDADSSTEATCAMTPADTTLLTEADTGRAVQIPVNGSLRVSLVANPSTGYTWSYRATPEGVLVETSSEYISNQPVLPGTGGKQCLRFGAGQAGTTSLEFEYRRPWETDQGPMRVVRFEVTVR